MFKGWSLGWNVLVRWSYLREEQRALGKGTNGVGAPPRLLSHFGLLPPPPQTGCIAQWSSWGAGLPFLSATWAAAEPGVPAILAHGSQAAGETRAGQGRAGGRRPAPFLCLILISGTSTAFP